MGPIYSSECTDCGHPLLSALTANEVNAWMQQAVAIDESGAVLFGIYDGFGRFEEASRLAYPPSLAVLESAEPEEAQDAISCATVWHDACWRKAGSPTDYRGVSNFVMGPAHDSEDAVRDMTEPAAPGRPLTPLRTDPFESVIRARAYSSETHQDFPEFCDIDPDTAHIDNVRGLS